MRKMFDSVIIAEARADLAIPDYSSLARQIKQVASFEASPGFAAGVQLEVLVAPTDLTFVVRDANDVDNTQSYFKDLGNLWEWQNYVRRSVEAMRQENPATIEGFLQNAFGIAKTPTWDSAATQLGSRIGNHLVKELGLYMGEGSRSLQSQKLYTELAHIALGFSPEINGLHKRNKVVSEAQALVYAQDSFKPLF